MLCFKIPLSFSISLTKKILPFPLLSENPRKTLNPFSRFSKLMASSTSWACSKCTFINQDSQKPTCQVCLSSQSPPPFSSSPSASSNQEKWSCKACTFLNQYQKSSCEVCGTRNSAFSSILRLEDEELELGSSVGNVFLPLLQRCSTKRKTRDDDPVEFANDSSVDLGGSRGVKSANKAVVDSVKVADDSVYSGGSPVVTTADKALDSVKAADDSFDLSASHGAKSTSKAVVTSGETQQEKDSGTLKILSYNVWFAEDLELRIRMNAIGHIIQQHSPDVICFQEVTPNIYALFQKSSWWKSYRCSLSSDMAASRGYYCMQLSKLPVKSFSLKQYGYSAMGRELCVTEVTVLEDTPLVVATSHLESPCPGPPKWDQMYSKERVQQAKEAVEFLKQNSNVIFCGDMNWDDKLDGQFPLPDGWMDAWTELRPKEIGWTYDTKANLMLTANKKLQKRLDRFLVSLRDFKVNGIDMVGTKAIPGATYVKQKRGGKELELPVLPSDHFGLLLTISARQNS